MWAYAVPVIASILILGAVLVSVSFDDAFAVQQGDVISFKGNTNKVVVDPASNWPAKAKVRIQFSVDNVDEFVYDGQGRIALEIKFEGKQSPQPIVISSGNSFSYTYDDFGNIVGIPPDLIQDDSGSTWLFSGTGEYNLDKKDKSRANFILTLVGQDGEFEGVKFTIPVKGGVIMMPITS